MINNSLKKQLRQQAHHLEPIVIIGDKGLTEAVLAEIERALDDHELIKIKIRAAERELRQQIIEKIGEACQADLIQTVGHTCTIYRKRKD